MRRLELATAYRAVEQAKRAELADEDLEVRLAELTAAAHAAWPGIAMRVVDFVRFVAERTASGYELAPERAADLWIACACATGNAAAIAAFEAAYFSDLRTALARLRLDAATFDEAKQKIRRELFVGAPGTRPKIAEYSGRGELRGWFRVMAVRSALKLLRGPKRQAVDDDALLQRVEASDGGPEVAFMKELYRPAFKQAFQEALDGLAAREQNLLRQHYVDGLTVDQLGALYGVHRATAARWVAAARAALVARTRANFVRRARVTDSECDSILRLLESQLGATIRRRLEGADRR